MRAARAMTDPPFELPGIGPNGILAEVRGFLDGLRREWPEVFTRPRRVSPQPSPQGLRDEIFRARASFWAERLGVTFGAVRVKSQRTLWGSCSRQGNLNFNWRLSLAPCEILDYVVVHELAHRLEMNHSPRFWEVVARHCPDHKTHRRWLRKNGPELYRAERPTIALRADAGLPAPGSRSTSLRSS